MVRIYGVAILDGATPHIALTYQGIDMYVDPESTAGASRTCSAQKDSAFAARRLRFRQSVLDHTGEQIAAINPRLGQSDRSKLDEYLTAVRDVESRLQLAAPTDVRTDLGSDVGDAWAIRTTDCAIWSRVAAQVGSTQGG